MLVGIDGSRESELATAVAFDEAARRKVGLTALHTWSDVSVFDSIVSLPGPGWPALRAVEDEILAERLAGWGESYPDVPVCRVIARDEPARESWMHPSRLSSWWSAAMAAADSPECCWARSARQ